MSQDPSSQQSVPENPPNLDELDFMEKRLERKLEEPLRTTFFGKRFASLHNFFSSWYDKMLWNWYGAEVERAQRREKENEIRKNRPKLRKEFPSDQDAP